jgi:GT2 family glycosyltransferase
LNKPNVSVIIPTYNRHDILGDTIAMLLSQDYGNLEVAVVDQTATPFPQREEFRGNQSATFEYHWVPRPNLPAARNLGLTLTSGEIVIFLDDDVAIGPDYVQEVVETYTADDIGGVCGVTIPEGCPDEASETIRVANLLGLVEPFKPNGILAVRSMMGVNMSFRRCVFARAGLFDEAFIRSGWGEDTELVLRVRKLGYRFLFNPRARVIHLEPASGGCSNRDVVVRERIVRERLVFTLYALMKHAKWHPLDALREYWSICRGHALNKAVLRSGGSAIMRRALEVFSATRQALAYLMGKRVALL